MKGIPGNSKWEGWLNKTWKDKVVAQQENELKIGIYSLFPLPLQMIPLNYHLGFFLFCIWEGVTGLTSRNTWFITVTQTQKKSFFATQAAKGWSSAEPCQVKNFIMKSDLSLKKQRLITDPAPGPASSYAVWIKHEPVSLLPVWALRVLKFFWTKNINEKIYKERSQHRPWRNST